MPKAIFSGVLGRHMVAPNRVVAGETVGVALQEVFGDHLKLRG